MTVFYTLSLLGVTTLWTTIEKAENELISFLTRVGARVFRQVTHNENNPIHQWTEYTIIDIDGEEFSAMIYPSRLDYSLEFDREV